MENKSKNVDLLLSFSRYCQEHKDERFWQALSNWSGFNYIGWADNPDGKNFCDMYHYEEKTK